MNVKLSLNQKEEISVISNRLKITLQSSVEIFKQPNCDKESNLARNNGGRKCSRDGRTNAYRSKG